MLKPKLYLIAALALCSFSFSQDEVKIMSYNILNYPGSDTTTRNPYFRTVISDINPDILVVQEMISQAGMNGFLNNIMNSFGENYSAGVFIDGPDTDNGVFYKTNMFEFISNTPIKTALRDINEFKLVSISSGDTIRLFSVHLKASNTSDDRLKRAAEVDSLRKFTNNLHSGANFIVLGDFNIYSSNEPAYQKLIEILPGVYGHTIDRIEMTGTFNNAAYAQHHTQSTRTRSFGGGATGGLDDRFDMMLYSGSVLENGGIYKIPQSFVVFGNDGNHFNDSINHPPNTAVGQEIANALHYESDHLPIYARFNFDDILPVELTTFTAEVAHNSVYLNWTTDTEINNYGFYIERNHFSSHWEEVGFIAGNENSNTVTHYSFIDKELADGVYRYRLKQLDYDGSFKHSHIVEAEIISINQYALAQNYPNPFNPVTNIEFSLPGDEHVKIEVYNILGEKVSVLINSYLPAGLHTIRFNGDVLTSGLYFYTMRAGEFSSVRKMTLLK